MDESDFKQHYIDRMADTTGLSKEICRDFICDIIDNYKQMFGEKTLRVKTNNTKKIKQKNGNMWLKCNHKQAYKFHPDSPTYCPVCNRYDWYNGQKIDNLKELSEISVKYPLDWLAKEVGVFVNKTYLGNANNHTLHRIVIANRIVRKWLDIPVDVRQYTMSNINECLNQLIGRSNSKKNISLNRMEADIAHLHFSKHL